MASLCYLATGICAKPKTSAIPKDMGLGKTLQSTCMLASNHHHRAEKYAATKAADCAHAPSVVICPPTLTGHWFQELQQYAEFLKPVDYTGTPAERDE